MKARQRIEANFNHLNNWPKRVAVCCGTILLLLACCLAVVVQTDRSSTNSSIQNLESISNWLELISSNANKRNESTTARRQSLASGIAFEVSPPNQLFQYQTATTTTAQRNKPKHEPSRQILAATANRNARTLASDTNSGEQLPRRSAQLVGGDEFQGQQELELLVSNVCERDFMLVRVQTNRPFYGVIHTLNHRRKPQCTLEGNGAVEYQLNISHVLDSRDPQHCGVIKLSRGQVIEPTMTLAGELLSVVVAIRTHRNVELPDDKFLVLNCTNRCRLADCSNPVKQRQLEMEDDIGPPNSQRSWWARGAKRPGGSLLQQQQRRQEDQNQAACSIWQFTWLVVLACCLAILLVGAAISNCVICRLVSFSNRTPRPSPEALGSSKMERPKMKQHTINYDNRKPVDVDYAQTVAKAPNRTRRGRIDYQYGERAQANSRNGR